MAIFIKPYLLPGFQMIMLLIAVFFFGYLNAYEQAVDDANKFVEKECKSRTGFFYVPTDQIFVDFKNTTIGGENNAKP